MGGQRTVGGSTRWDSTQWGQRTVGGSAQWVCSEGPRRDTGPFQSFDRAGEPGLLPQS